MTDEDSSQAVHQIEGGQWARSIFIPLLPIFAVFLGGSTEKWAEGIVVGLLGLFLIVQPPRRSLGWAINIVFVSLALSALVVFLPQTWFFMPEWRSAVLKANINLPITVTPQPWLTAGCFASFAAPLCWLYRVSAQQLELRVARFQLSLYTVAVVILAALSIAFYLTQHPLPFWKNAFGPFPNSDQTADLFATVSVLILAAAQDDIRHGRTRWLLWLVPVAIIVIAMLLNFSRAAVVIMLSGSAIWVAVVAIRIGVSSKRHRLGMWMALSVSLLMLLVIARLLRQAGLHAPLFIETWRLICSSPWTGIGLGNFEPVSTIFSEPSHYDGPFLSGDWLWATAELGWLAMALILAGFALLIRRVAPLELGSNQRFRLAALIGALMFSAHGLIDASGHHVGTAYASLFLLGLSLHRPTQLRISKTTSWIFRLVGAVLFTIGLSWTVSSRTMALLPGSVGVASAKQRANFARHGRNFHEAVDLTTTALEWAPLDWELYYLRANAQIAQNLPRKAVEDLRRARFLHPNAAPQPSVGQGGLGGGEPRNRNAEGAATDIIKSDSMAKLDRIWVAPVFSTDAELDVATRPAPFLDCDFHQLANSSLINRRERISFNNFQFGVMREE